MPHISLAAILVALLASASPWAQASNGDDRVITPGAFLGVDLKRDFLTEVPECASEDNRAAELCRVATKKKGRFEVRGLPYLPISPGYKLFVTVNERTVSQLMLTGNANSLYMVKEMLTEQLGKPAAVGTHQVKLKSGASFEAEAYKWNTQGVAVDFGRDLSDLGRYSVTFSTSVLGEEIGQNELAPIANTPSL